MLKKFSLYKYTLCGQNLVPVVRITEIKMAGTSFSSFDGL